MWQVIVAAPLIALLVAAVLPLVLLIWVWHSTVSLWLISHARLKWPPHTVALVAYTNSAKWAPYIERQLLPLIGGSCVVVNRSEPNWKAKFPLEARVLRHWGGHLNYNPITIVFPRRGRARVFRLYRPFLNNYHGKPEALTSAITELTATVERLANVT